MLILPEWLVEYYQQFKKSCIKKVFNKSYEEEKLRYANLLTTPTNWKKKSHRKSVIVSFRFFFIYNFH